MRFDDEKSCIGVYFEKYKYNACVFYSWRDKDGKRTIWNNSYYLKSSKFQNYMFCKRSHPKEVKSLQPSTIPQNYINGMLETYQELCSLFSAQDAFYFVGVNVNDKISYETFCTMPHLPRFIGNFRLIGSKSPKVERVRDILRSANVLGTIRVSHQIGSACMQEELINSKHIVLDDPEWISREELLSLNCITVDIGHNNLTADDLNAFLLQWMFIDSDQTRLERMEITLSPEAFRNKAQITNGLMLLDWDPRRREGEHFDSSYYLSRSTIRDPYHFLDCKFSKDILRDDGRLATILFYGKKLYFLVWKDRFPYKTIKDAKKQQKERKVKKKLTRALNDALRDLNVRSQNEWNQKTEWLEAVLKTRKAVAEEEQNAKRKYFQALKEFLDTSEPKPKRRLLRTITIFKKDVIP